MDSEYKFLEYARKTAPDIVPLAYACDHETGLALYEYIEGEHVKSGELTWNHVAQAADFFCKLNDPASKQKAYDLPRASEACFSIADHLAVVNARIIRLIETVNPGNKKGSACDAVPG